MKWYKQDGNSDSNPKIQRAGFWGARVYECLCRISADFELDGTVPAHYVDPTYLARRMMATDVLPLEQAEAAISKALAKLADPEPKWQLIAIDEQGDVTIIGWRRAEEPQSSTERSRNHRKVKELEAQLAELRALLPADAPPEPPPEPAKDARNGDATPRNVRNGATGEERRGDQTREEDPPPSPSGAAEGLPAGLTATQLAERWNAEVADADSEKGKVRIPLSKGIAKRTKERLASRPAWEDWAPVFERARQLRREAGCTWLDFPWLIENDLKAQHVLSGRYDFKLEQARGAAPIPFRARAPVGGLPRLERPERPPLKPGDRDIVMCRGCASHFPATFDGQSWTLEPHDSMGLPCEAAPAPGWCADEGARSFA
ncbi:hypothetical protein [Vulgatibacter sp.]|uniref:hypothetical protein n=1 Tax=Vulgatibacter sp. TaxID=1971226 RepID=UPI00356A6E94